jgi:hypothetical protein
MKTDPLIGSAATAQAFKSAAERADIFHYHGHVKFEVDEPLESAFKLHGGQNVTARDLPLGLVPVLLLAGANAVVGTLWNCWDTAGKEFTETLYQIICRERERSSGFDQEPSSSAVNLALALREAVLNIRERRLEPYFWALFVLYGNWDLVCSGLHAYRSQKAWKTGLQSREPSSMCCLLSSRSRNNAGDVAELTVTNIVYALRYEATSEESTSECAPAVSCDSPIPRLGI